MALSMDPLFAKLFGTGRGDSERARQEAEVEREWLAWMHVHRNCARLLAVGGDEDEIVTFVCCHEGHDAGIGDNRFSLPRELAERIRNRVG